MKKIETLIPVDEDSLIIGNGGAQEINTNLWILAYKINELIEAWNSLPQSGEGETVKILTKGKCNGAHCRCMNLDKACPNFHYGDHECPFDKPEHVETLGGGYIGGAGGIGGGRGYIIDNEPTEVEGKTEGWEKEFERFVPFIEGTVILDWSRPLPGVTANYINLKSFISSLLSTRDKELEERIQQYREDVLAIIQQR